MYKQIKRKLLRRVVSQEVLTAQEEETKWQDTGSDDYSVGSEDEVEEEKEEEEEEEQLKEEIPRKSAKSKKVSGAAGKLEVPVPNEQAFIYDNTDYIEGNDPLTRVQKQLEKIKGSRTLWISAPALYHFYFDDSWKCGFRNIQILALAAKSSGRPEIEKRLFHGCGFIPSVESIQR